MKRRRAQPFLGAEPDNALPTGPLTLNHLPPIPLPIRTPGLRHHLVLRMSLVESYPGIQATTARKAGDLLTFTKYVHRRPEAVERALTRTRRSAGVPPTGRAGRFHPFPLAGAHP